MIFKLSNVVPNPFRDLSTFPLEEWRITKLMGSIKTNRFTPNVLGRVRDGKLQLAYGHHRVAALRNLGETEAEFIVQELSDDDMIQKMSTDNDAAFSHGMRTVIENVRAAVLGFASGTVKRPEIDKHTNPLYLRYAPSFIAGLKNPPPDAVPYTKKSVGFATGLLLSDGRKGWKADLQVEGALETLGQIERGLWDMKACLHYIETNETEGATLVRADYLKSICKSIVERARVGLVVSQKNTAAATAQQVEGQRNLDAIRKVEAEKQTRERADVHRLAEIAVEAERDELDRKWKERREREEREKAAEPERRRKRRELKKKLKADEEARKAAEKEAARAAAKQALANKPPKGSEPPKVYFPELPELIKHFEEPLPACATKVLKDKALLSAEQKEAIQQSIKNAIGNVTSFWKQLLSS